MPMAILPGVVVGARGSRTLVIDAGRARLYRRRRSRVVTLTMNAWLRVIGVRFLERETPDGSAT
jgi:hypothetical protein